MEDLTLFKNIQEAKNKKLLEISNEKNIEKKMNLYEELLKIDNTDKKILLQYLNFCIEINGGTSDMKVKMKEDFIKYSKYFPPEEWNKNFSGVIQRKDSSLEKLELIFKKIIEHDWILADDISKKDITKFIRNKIKECSGEIGNSYPITWKNEELFIYYSLKEFVDRLMSKIVFYSKESQYKNLKNDLISYYNTEIEKLKIQILNVQYGNDNDKEIDKELDKEKDKEKVLEIDKKEKIENLNKKIEEYKGRMLNIGFNEGGFFSKYLNNFYYFLLSIKDTYLKDFCKKKFLKKEEQDIFEHFMLFISSYDFEEIPDYMISVWKYSFLDLDESEKDEIFRDFIKKKNPKEFSRLGKDKIKIIFAKNIKEVIIINNINDYEIENLFNKIKISGNFNENECIKFVKINKINNHIYIKKIMNEWISFNIHIFNLLAIQSLYNILFDNQDNSLFQGNELKIIIENITYFVFPTDFSGLTKRKTMKIYEYGAMIWIDGEEDFSKIITLAFSLVCNMHEIIGHYNIGYQAYSNPKEAKKFDSPKIDPTIASKYAEDRGFKEAGENIEIQLFGRKITFLTLKEALFILNSDNYKVHYQTFRKNFMECNSKKISIDEKFKDTLVNAFKINIDKINTKVNKEISIDDYIKRKVEQKSYAVKGSHPPNFNIDGVNNNNFESLDKLISAMENYKPETNN